MANSESRRDARCVLDVYRFRLRSSQFAVRELVLPDRGQKKRSGRDSNPRYGYPYTAFPVRPLQPLGHRSMAYAPRLGILRHSQGRCQDNLMANFSGWGRRAVTKRRAQGKTRPTAPEVHFDFEKWNCYAGWLNPFPEGVAFDGVVDARIAIRDSQLPSEPAPRGRDSILTDSPVCRHARICGWGCTDKLVCLGTAKQSRTNEFVRATRRSSAGRNHPFCRPLATCKRR